MIENEAQYYAICEELDHVSAVLADAMQYGRPPHLDSILWQISTKSAVNYVLRLEAELAEYNGRISGFYSKGGER